MEVAVLLEFQHAQRNQPICGLEDSARTLADVWDRKHNFRLRTLPGQQPGCCNLLLLFMLTFEHIYQMGTSLFMPVGVKNLLICNRKKETGLESETEEKHRR